MKIIGKTDNGYIAEISHIELEKSADKYYGKLEKLKVGDNYDLGKGYDFRNDLRRASDAMTDASKAYQDAVKTMSAFALMFSQHTDDTE